jgi:hypothetical protein
MAKRQGNSGTDRVRTPPETLFQSIQPAVCRPLARPQPGEFFAATPQKRVIRQFPNAVLVSES